MVVSCSKCSTKFKIADDKISAAGVKVRCSKCKHTFVVSPAGVAEVDGANDSGAASRPPAAAEASKPTAAAGASKPTAAAGAKPEGTLPPPPAAAGAAGAVPPPPASPEAPLPPPPKIVSSPPAAEADGADELPEDIFSSPTKVGPAPGDDPPAGGDLPLPPPPPPPPAADSAFGVPPADADSLPATTRDPLGEDPFAASMTDGPTARVDAPAGQQASPGDDADEGLFADLDAAVEQTLGQESPAASTPDAGLAPPPPPPPPASSKAAQDAAGDSADEAGASIPGFESADVGGPAGQDPFSGTELDLPEGAPAEAPPLTTSAADFMQEAAVANPQPAEAPAPAGEAPGGPAADDPFAGIDVDASAPSPAPAASSDPFSGIDAGQAAGAPDANADPFADIDIDAGAASQPAAATSDDPFADISLDAPPAAGDGQPAAALAPPGGGDMFGDLGDPFAGAQDAAPDAGGATSAPPPLPAGDAPGLADGGDLFGADEIKVDPAAAPAGDGVGSAASDPFASLDTEAPAPTGGMDMSVGHDPFSSLDTADDAMPMDDGPELGLAMDADGKVGGQEPPKPPPSTKAVASPAQADDEPAAQAVQRPTGPPPMASAAVPDEGGRTSLPVKIGFGLVLLVLALFVFVVYRHGGKPDLTRWSTYVEAFTGHGGDTAVAGDMVARGLSSTTYPNRDGHALVVLWGQVDNTASEKKAGIVVRGQLLGEDHQVLQEQVVPAGVTFDPLDIHAMVDPHAVGDAYRAGFSEAPRELAPGESLPFMVVMFERPDRLAEVRVRVIPAESEDPLAELPPPAPPAVDSETAAGDTGEPAPVALPAKSGAKRPKRPKRRAADRVDQTGDVVRLGPRAKRKRRAGQADPP